MGQSPVSWGCPGNSAVTRRGTQGVRVRGGVLVPQLGRGGSLGAVPREAGSQEQNVAQHVTAKAGWGTRNECGLGKGF